VRAMTRDSSDSFLVVAVLAAFGLFFFGQIIFDNLVYAWLTRELEQHFGVLGAEVLVKSSSIVLLSLVGIATVVCLYFFLKRQLAELASLS
jgi:hypothetical protein